MATSMPLDLDHWLPKPAIRTFHRRSASVSPDELFAAASTVRLDEARSLGRVVRWRIPGTPPDITYRELFASYPFTLLDEGENWSISGLAGKIWSLHRDYPRLEDPEEFRTWSRPGTSRVLFAHWIEEGEDGRSELVSEARIKGTDRLAGIRLRALWTVVGPFEKLIGSEALRLAAKRAEEQAGRSPTPAPQRG